MAEEPKPTRTPQDAQIAAKEQQDLKVEVLSQMSALITAAFGLVAALAWNTAIQDVFKTYLATGTGILAELGYAITVTVLAVVLVIYVGKLANAAKEKAGKLHLPRPHFPGYGK